MNKTEVGIIGLGVMGRSLAKNAINNGFSISVYNRWTETEKDIVPDFVKEVDGGALGFTDLAAFVASLQKPRKILLMITAGSAVDFVINELTPHLDKEDIIADGGNSHYLDTQRRVSQLNEVGIHFLGVGISGGEKGALEGPCIMPGGNSSAYAPFENILKAMAAKDKDGNPCVSLVGLDGAGHLVKTVHNGIEYGEMQLIADCYAVLSTTHSNEEIAAIFSKWNQGVLQSYLLGITAAILRKKDGDVYLIDKVLDKAGNKGTGSWTSQLAFQLGVPVPTINAAVTARYLSSLKESRMKWGSKIKRTDSNEKPDVKQLEDAYLASRMINHHQGFEVIRSASNAFGWNIDLAEVARIWTEGCIIKSNFMEECAEILQNHSSLMDQLVVFGILTKRENAWKETIKYSLSNRILINCISESYNYFKYITSEQSSAHIIQAQRDEFGAHTYRRTDRPENESFTTNWTENG